MQFLATTFISQLEVKQGNMRAHCLASRGLASFDMECRSRLCRSRHVINLTRVLVIENGSIYQTQQFIDTKVCQLPRLYVSCMYFGSVRHPRISQLTPLCFQCHKFICEFIQHPTSCPYLCTFCYFNKKDQLNLNHQHPAAPIHTPNEMPPETN